MTKQRLNPLASAWILMESPDTPLHTAVMAVFECPAKASKGYVTELATTLRGSKQVVAPWDWVLSEALVPGLPPSITAAEDVELDYHFRHSALPAPGGERELGMLISRLHSNALDHSRPLWEFHLIEGLENNRFAFYLKVHRALIDNVNAVPLMLQVLSSSARSHQIKPIWSQPITATERAERTPLQAVMSVAESASKASLGLMRGVLGRKTGSVIVPNSAPRSTLNRPISHSRRFATWQLEQDRVERLAAATDSTVNEILSYLVGSSLRRFFKEYNALPDESLVGLLPVSMRERSDHSPGGAVTGLRVELGTHIGNPQARLEAVKKSVKAVRADRESLPQEAATAYVLMRAAPIIASQLATLGRLVPPLFNLEVSVSSGPEKPAYFNGARLQAIYPLSHLLQYAALSIGCVSYAGTLNFGFTGARETLPHLQRLAVYLGRAMDDLEASTYEDRETT